MHFLRNTNNREDPLRILSLSNGFETGKLIKNPYFIDDRRHKGLGLARWLSR